MAKMTAEKLKECRKKYNSKYYKKNAEKLKTKCECVCGGNYTKYGKKRHEKSMKHTLYIANKANELNDMASKIKTLQDVINFLENKKKL